jgi:hypothetical protein
LEIILELAEESLNPNRRNRFQFSDLIEWLGKMQGALSEAAVAQGSGNVRLTMI